MAGFTLFAAWVWEVFTNSLKAGIPLGMGLIGWIVYTSLSPSNFARRRKIKTDKEYPPLKEVLRKGFIMTGSSWGIVDIESESFQHGDWMHYRGLD
jgi:hypothetical protein